MTRFILTIAIAIPLAAGLYVLLKPDTPSQRTASSTSQPTTEVTEKSAVLEITAKNFEALVADSELPVVVDFWASWCGPCMMLGPHVEEIATEYQGQAIVGKVNVDQQPELAKQFKASAIPLVLVFQDGKIVQRFPEFKPGTPDQIREAIDRTSQ